MRSRHPVHMLAFLALLLSAGVAPAAAQSRTVEVRLGGSLGAHGLGVAADLGLGRAALAIRAEGLVSRREVVGGGLNFDLARSSTSRMYGIAMAGRVSCGTGLFYRACDMDPQTGFGAIGGFEVAASDSGIVSLGVEGGYWFTAADDDETSLAHPTFAATVRLRPASPF